MASLDSSGFNEEDSSQNTVITVSIDFSNRNIKAKQLEIYSSICALINSKDGIVVLKLKNDNNGEFAKELERNIRQRFDEILEKANALDTIKRISLPSEELAFKVKNLSSLCTFHSNMYLPKDEQVLELKNATDIKEVWTR